MSTIVNLSHNQVVDLSILRDQQNYAQAYDYLRDIVHQQRILETNTGRSYELLKLENWLDRASSINSNDGSFSSEFVRGATEGIRERLGRPLSEAEFQSASDALAKTVIKNVIDHSGVPSAKEIIRDDVAAAVGDPSGGGLGLPMWGWAGTWGDVLPPPIGLGGDYASISGTSVRDYAKNWMLSANAQIVDGLGRVLVNNWNQLDALTDVDSLLDSLFSAIDNIADLVSAALRNNPDPSTKITRYWFSDPLVLDLDGDGFETTPLAKTPPVMFDGDADAIKNATAWIGSDDGLVVLDRNGNGTIDNGGELFGDATLLTTGPDVGKKAAHGFAALADLDSNLDGRLDASDAQFGVVRIWRDFNQDGLSQSDELKTLSDSGVASITLASTASATSYGDGLLARDGSFTRTDGSTAQADFRQAVADMLWILGSESAYVSASDATSDSEVNLSQHSHEIPMQSLLRYPLLHTRDGMTTNINHFTQGCRRARRASVPTGLRARGRGVCGVRLSVRQHRSWRATSVATANWLRPTGTATRHACGGAMATNWSGAKHG